MAATDYGSFFTLLKLWNMRIIRIKDTMNIIYLDVQNIVRYNKDTENSILGGWYYVGCKLYNASG